MEKVTAYKDKGGALHHTQRACASSDILNMLNSAARKGEALGSLRGPAFDLERIELMVANRVTLIHILGSLDAEDAS